MGDSHRLLVTEESGRLARWLRLMGYDVAMGAPRPLAALYRQAYNESRTIITRNRRVQPGRLIRVVHLSSAQLAEQLRQLMRELGLRVEPGQAFSRCDICNVAVEPVEKAAVKDRVPPYVFETQPAFHRCPVCQRVYWAATHYDRARRFFDTLSPRGSGAW
ncbi:MAG: hypothetical protein HYT90_05770 [Candidatus Omnitrophica bacterium]|nr:hypothetical protein [Candidatus Omnitrophota bacterium]